MHAVILPRLPSGPIQERSAVVCSLVCGRSALSKQPVCGGAACQWTQRLLAANVSANTGQHAPGAHVYLLHGLVDRSRVSG